MPILQVLETERITTEGVGGKGRIYTFEGSLTTYEAANIQSATGIKPVTNANKSRIRSRVPDLLLAGLLIPFTITLEKTGKRLQRTIFFCQNKDLNAGQTALIGATIDGGKIVGVSARVSQQQYR